MVNENITAANQLIGNVCNASGIPMHWVSSARTGRRIHTFRKFRVTSSTAVHVSDCGKQPEHVEDTTPQRQASAGQDLVATIMSVCQRQFEDIKCPQLSTFIKPLSETCFKSVGQTAFVV